MTCASSTTACIRAFSPVPTLRPGTSAVRSARELPLSCRRGQWRLRADGGGAARENRLIGAVRDLGESASGQQGQAFDSGGGQRLPPPRALVHLPNHRLGAPPPPPPPQQP